MDGNGRWAEARGLPRLAGHVAGVAAVRRAVEAAPELGVGTLSLFAFSSDNWRRPPEEVAGLMDLLGRYFESERRRCVEAGVRVRAIGRRDRFGAALYDAIAATEDATRAGRTLELRIAIDYSARDSIVEAARRGDRQSAERQLSPAVDLLIRTGGERRLSDFLLWECAYAELLFLRRGWPDFGRDDLASAVAEFRRRDRRFGALPSQPEVAAPRWLE